MCWCLRGCRLAGLRLKRGPGRCSRRIGRRLLGRRSAFRGLPVRRPRVRRRPLVSYLSFRLSCSLDWEDAGREIDVGESISGQFTSWIVAWLCVYRIGEVHENGLPISAYALPEG